MKRHVSGVGKANASSAPSVPDGIFLVRVEHAQYHWHAQKPYYTILFRVEEPALFAGIRFTARLYCTPKAHWKLNWFLREFGYDPELLERDEIDEKALLGLRGITKISNTVINGVSVLNLDGFAPSARWSDFSQDSGPKGQARAS